MKFVNHISSQPGYVEGQSDDEKNMVRHSPLFQALAEEGVAAPKVDLSIVGGGLRDYGMAPPEPNVIIKETIEKEPVILRQQSSAPRGGSVIADIIASRG